MRVRVPSVLAKKLHVRHSDVFHPGVLWTGTVGKRAKFTVTAKDEDGQRLEQGADRFDVLVFTDDGDCIVDAVPLPIFSKRCRHRYIGL